MINKKQIIAKLESLGLFGEKFKIKDIEKALQITHKVCAENNWLKAKQATKLRFVNDLDVKHDIISFLERKGFSADAKPSQRIKGIDMYEPLQKMFEEWIKKKMITAGEPFPRTGPLSNNKNSNPEKGILWDIKLELKDSSDRLLFKPVVDFDTILNNIWFFEDLFSGLKRQLELEGNDVKFKFKNKEYAIEAIAKTNDPNYYLVAKVKTGH